MIKLILEFLFILSPTLIESGSDLYRAKVKKKTDTHTKDIWRLRIPLMVGVSLLTPLIFPNEFIYPLHVVQTLAYTTGLFIFLFDPIMGIGLTGNPFFLGISSKTDLFFKDWPKFNVLFVRIWVFLLTYFIYYQFDRVLNYPY